MEQSLIWFSFFCVFVYFENILLWENVHKIKCTILTTFKCPFSSIKYIHIVVQPSPPSLPRTFSSSPIETLYPLNPNSQFLISQPLATSILLSAPKNLTTLATSRKWNHTMFVLLLLAYFTYNVLKVHTCCNKCKNFLPFLKKFYWSIVDFQSCVSFRCTAKWISYMYTCIHSFLDSFPI